MPDLDVVQAIAGLHATALLVIAVAAFVFDVIRVAKVVKAREKELIDERDEWKNRALASDKRVNDLADAFGTAYRVLARAAKAGALGDGLDE